MDKSLNIEFDRLNIFGYNRDLLSCLMESRNELIEFEMNYYDPIKIIISIAKYRKHKLRQQKTTYEEIEQMYNKDKTNAMSKLFLQPVHNFEIERLESLMHSGKITLKKLFDLHMEQPELVLNRFLT